MNYWPGTNITKSQGNAFDCAGSSALTKGITAGHAQSEAARNARLLRDHKAGLTTPTQKAIQKHSGAFSRAGAN